VLKNGCGKDPLLHWLLNRVLNPSTSYHQLAQVTSGKKISHHLFVPKSKHRSNPNQTNEMEGFNSSNIAILYFFDDQIILGWNAA
jgi:hypothetical protein